MKAHPKPFPPLHSDEEAEQFVDTVDLSEYDLSVFKPMRFEIEPKAASLNMRLPASLLDAVKGKRPSLHAVCAHAAGGRYRTPEVISVRRAWRGFLRAVRRGSSPVAARHHAPP